MLRRISDNELFETGKAEGLILGLIRDCFEKKAALKMEIVGGLAEISISESEPGTSRIIVTLQGLTKTPDPFSSAAIGARLMAPLLGEIVQISLPYSQIHFTRCHGQSIADFFVRNLALGLCRPEAADLKTTTNREVSTFASKLGERYLQALMSLIDDEALSTRAFTDKLQMDSHFKIISFQSAILQSGARDLRQQYIAQQLPGGATAEDMKDQFTEIRARMIQHFEA
ncbi:MAG: hypothetical protein AAF950_01330 [Pseudomonadota bacterium]